MSGNKSEDSVIVSWIGSSDIYKMNQWREEQGLEITCVLDSFDATPYANENSPGPVRELTDNISAKIIYLLATDKFECAEDEIKDWISSNAKNKNTPVEVVKTKVKNPSSYTEVYKALSAFFKKYWKSSEASLFKFNLTPGTSVTHAVMLYMSQVAYPGGKAYQTYRPKYADNFPYEEAVLPFKLSGEIASNESVSIEDNDFEDIKRIYAPNRDINILLLGESGTGKSISARKLHDASGAAGDFVVANCAELADGDTNMFRSSLFGHVKGAFSGATSDREGLFEKAKNGTIFIDEIGEIPLAQQAILLRALQEKKFIKVGDSRTVDIKNVRIIAATNHDLQKEVQEHRFREDLYYRIAVCSYRLPNLRERIRDDQVRFEDLVNQIISNLTGNGGSLEGASITLTDSALNILKKYKWPGNVRQLEHVLLLSSVYANSENNGVIDDRNINIHLKNFGLNKDDGTEISDETFIPDNVNEWLEKKKAEFVNLAMKECNNQIGKAAKRLGMTYQQVKYFVERK